MSRRLGQYLAGVKQRGAAMAAARADNRAAISASDAVTLIVSLTVAGLVAAFLLPVALDEIVTVDTGNYSSGAQSLWNIMDLIIVLGAFLFFVGAASRYA